jgi:hypothetical protein
MSVMLVQTPKETFEVHYEGRAYEDQNVARLAWERMEVEHLLDCGATRCRSPHEPEGPGRFVVFMAFGEEAWGRLAPFREGGELWEPPEDFVAFLVERRLEQALRGEPSRRIRRPD